MPNFEFITIVPGTVELGWRFDKVLSVDDAADLAGIVQGHDFRELFFSPRRTVTLAPFQIATTAIDWNEFEFENNPVDSDTISGVCELMNRELKSYGWRLPTEDEFEAAVGGELFFWGNEIPTGNPLKTDFTRHWDLAANGLRLNHDPYHVELVQSAFKFGDGGCAICGGEVGAINWIPLATSYRVPWEYCQHCLAEFLEDARIRPVWL